MHLLGGWPLVLQRPLAACVARQLTGVGPPKVYIWWQVYLLYTRLCRGPGAITLASSPWVVVLAWLLRGAVVPHSA
jgi:hypothetical protein